MLKKTVALLLTVLLILGTLIVGMAGVSAEETMFESDLATSTYAHKNAHYFAEAGSGFELNAGAYYSVKIKTETAGADVRIYIGSGVTTRYIAATGYTQYVASAANGAVMKYFSFTSASTDWQEYTFEVTDELGVNLSDVNYFSVRANCDFWLENADPKDCLVSVGHVHNWQEKYVSTENEHYKVCTSANCDITDVTLMEGYGEHTYTYSDKLCDVCKYDRYPTEYGTEYVISHFDDGANNGGAGLMDPLGKPMTALPDSSYYDEVNAVNYGEYCGTEWVEIADDDEAMGGKALKLHIESGYDSYNKTHLAIRKMGSEYTVREVYREYIYLNFRIKAHNLDAFDLTASGIELAEVIDQKEYFISFDIIDFYLLDETGTGIEEDTWVDVSIPLSYLYLSRLGTGNMDLNIARIYIDNEAMVGTYTDQPYIMIDEMYISDMSPEHTGTVTAGNTSFVDSEEIGVSGGGVYDYGWEDVTVAGEKGEAFYVGDVFSDNNVFTILHTELDASFEVGDDAYFYIYISDISNLNFLQWEIGSSGTYTGECMRYQIGASMVPYVLSSGWNRIDFEIADSSNLIQGYFPTGVYSPYYGVGLGGGMTGNVDYSNVNYFRIVAKTNDITEPLKLSLYNVNFDAVAPTFVSDFTYDFNAQNKTAVVTGLASDYTSDPSDLIIPETVTYKDVEYTVTAIAPRAFYGDYVIEGISIPSTVKKIGDSAFYNSMVYNVVMEEGVTEIGTNAFNYCYIDTLQIPASVKKIGAFAFWIVEQPHYASTSENWSKISIGAGNDTLEYVIPRNCYEAEANSDMMYLDGKWKQKESALLSGGGALYSSSQNGSSIRFSFNGTGFDIISYMGATQGEMQVYIDGMDYGFVDLYDESTDELFKTTVFSAEDLGNYEHEVVIYTNSKVHIDAISVQGTLVQNTYREYDYVTYQAEDTDVVTYSGSWKKRNIWKFDKHAAMFTDNGGSATVSYTGYGFIINSYTSSTQGYMIVTIDGEMYDIIDLYDDSIDQNFSQSVIDVDLEYGEHTIEITTIGKAYIDSIQLDGATLK